MRKNGWLGWLWEILGVKEAKVARIIDGLEHALAAKDMPQAEKLFAELEDLIPTDERMAELREQVAAARAEAAIALSRENEAKVEHIKECLENAIAAQDKLRTEWFFAELESLIPTDERMAELREQVTALPGPKNEMAVDLGGGVTMEFVLIKPGSFMMGSEVIDDAKPVHKVTITKPFYMGRYEVTQEQWVKVMGHNPSHSKGAKNPVEDVSWDDCVAFMVKLRKKVPGLYFILPTEAQWEYACRAGTTTAYGFGDDDRMLGEYAWYNSGNVGMFFKTHEHEVGGLKPNAWGLYDMHGNVREWCLDGFIFYQWLYKGSDIISDPAIINSPLGGKVLRGGSFHDAPESCRSAYRTYFDPSHASAIFGFRVVGGVPTAQTPQPSAAPKPVPLSQANPPAGKSQSGASFTERDNMGTRHDTSGMATAYWMGERMSMTRKDPFVLFTFDRAEDAKSALLELPCIHVATDSRKLICTEPLVFGYYQTGNGFEAIICGDDLTLELWEQAKQSFAKHGGRRKNDSAPTKRSSPPKSGQAKPDAVIFLREDVRQRGGHPCIYRVHKGPDAESAKAFLSQNPVTRQLLYLVVETPEGNYCRDIQGIYKEE